MKKLVSLLAMFMLVVSMASARTILVTDQGIVTDTDVHLRGGVNVAVNSAVAGDVVVLAAAAGDYLTSPGLTLNGITLKGQNRSVTLFAQNNPFPLSMKNGAVLENLHLKLPTGWGVGIRLEQGAFKVSKVLIDQGGTAYGPIVLAPSNVANPLTGLIEYVTIKNFGAPNGYIQMSDPWSVKLATDATGASVGPIVVNHCTLVYKASGYACMILAGYPDQDGAKLTVKNSIMGALDTSVTPCISAVSGMFFAGNHPDRPKADVVAINHHHNCYMNIWILEAHDWAASATEDNPETPDVDESKPAGFMDTGAVLADEAGSIGGTVWTYKDFWNPFKDAQNLDLSLMPDTSIALWKGDDGLHMGADVTTTPVELSAFEIE